MERKNENKYNIAFAMIIFHTKSTIIHLLMK